MDMTRILLLFVFCFATICIPIPIAFLLKAWAPAAEITSPLLARLDELTPAEAQQLFPAGYVPQPVAEAGSLGGWRAAKDGRTVSLLRFADEGAARTWVEGYRARQVKPEDEVYEFKGKFQYSREGEAAVVYYHGPLLQVIEAGNRPDAYGFEWSLMVPNPAANVLTRTFVTHQYIPHLLAGILIYCLLLVVPWVRAGSWATEVRPPEGIAPAGVDEVEAALLSINELNQPFRIVQHGPHRFLLEWRFQDETYVSFFKPYVERIAATHTIELRVDPEGQVVRAQDKSYTVSWAVDPATGKLQASLAGKMELGITLFQYSAGDSFGLVFADGKLSPQASYSYSFDVQEMRQPVIDLLRGLGWRYRPVVTFARWISG